MLKKFMHMLSWSIPNPCINFGTIHCWTMCRSLKPRKTRSILLLGNKIRAYTIWVAVLIFNVILRSMIFMSFQEWIASKGLEIDQDNLRMKFSALNVHFIKSGPSRFKKACTRGCQIGVPLLKSGYLSAAGLSNVKMVADRHRHAA